MKIDKNLNIVLRLRDNKGDFITHTVPLPTAMVDANWRVFRSAYEDIVADGVQSAVAVATTILKEAAQKHNRENEINDLLNEIAGATMVIRGKPILLGHSDLDDSIKEEVISRLIFFISWSRHVLPTQAQEWMNAISSVLNLELTSQSVSDLSSGLSTESEISKMTLDVKEPIGVMATSSPI